MRRSLKTRYDRYVRSRNELDETQQLYYPAIMQAIAATEYDGYVVLDSSHYARLLAALHEDRTPSVFVSQYLKD